jgi:hypothetical protein
MRIKGGSVARGSKLLKGLFTTDENRRYNSSRKNKSIDRYSRLCSVGVMGRPMVNCDDGCKNLHSCSFYLKPTVTQDRCRMSITRFAMRFPRIGAWT